MTRNRPDKARVRVLRLLSAATNVNNEEACSG
jgi:hypothetical protein